MSVFLVTVRLPRRPEHDPHNKIAGTCPVQGDYCSDTTGEHHTVLVDDMPDIPTVQAAFERLGYKITRIETGS